MSKSLFLMLLNRPAEESDYITKYIDEMQNAVDAGQALYISELVMALTLRAAVCAHSAMTDLDRALGVFKSSETIPASLLKFTPHIADLIYQTRAVTDFSNRVFSWAQQIANCINSIAPDHLGHFFPIAERAFGRLLLAAVVDQKEWVIALDVLGTARAQRLMKWAQADLLRRAVSDQDTDVLKHYRESYRRLAELDILLNVKMSPEISQLVDGRGKKEPDTRLYDEYIALRHSIRDLEKILRKQGLLPDFGEPLFNGAALREKLPENAALLLLVQSSKLPMNLGVIIRESSEPPKNLVVVITRDSGQAIFIENMADWVQRLEALSECLKSGGRALRRGPDMDTPNPDLQINEALPSEPVDTQAEDLIKVLQEQFWQPVQKALGDKKVDTVWLIPTGELHGLPWQASAPEKLTCRLAPAPWFVLQALERQSSTHPLSPSANAPLGILAYAAAPNDPDELFHLPLEEEAISTIWGEETTRRLDQWDTATHPPVTFMTLAGHGESDAYIPGAARIWVGYQGREKHYVGFGELIASRRQNLQFIYLSSCVVGKITDLHGEPLGLVSGGLLGGTPHLMMGWGIPVDDLGVALFSLLFHWHWRECGNPEKALTLTRNAFLTGDWPEEALKFAEDLLKAHLRELMGKWLDGNQDVRLRTTLWNLYEVAVRRRVEEEDWMTTFSGWLNNGDAQDKVEALAIGILANRADFPFRYIGYFAMGFGAVSAPTTHS
ncbi:MAG: CHAT domain-containing protein [Synechococcaceae cyanobacterium SM1_2_3]|nr:CHAT domain-containing protein [Synechococcaceae cyanobacterium SM1_2_3]